MDDVHNFDVVRLAYPFRGHDVFPATDASDLDAVLRQISEPYDDHGDVSPILTNQKIHKLATDNPVATAVVFHL